MKKLFHRSLCLFLAIVVLFSLAVPGFALGEDSEPVTLLGKVLCAGQPVEGILVYAQAGEEEPVTASTDEAGTYTLALAENTTYAITIGGGSEQYVSHTITVTTTTGENTAPEVTLSEREFVVHFTVENAAIWDTEGNLLTQETSVPYGKTLAFLVDPKAGYLTESVIANDEPLTETDGLWQLPITAETNITVTTVPIAPPIFSVEEEPETEWAAKRTYTITVDSISADLAGMYVCTTQPTNYEDLQAALEADSATTLPDGAFVATQPGTYYLAIMDTAKNVVSKEITVAGIDGQPPVVSTPVRAQGTWAKEATYTFTAEDTESGIASVTVSFGTDGEEKELTEDVSGTYSFTASENGEYIVRCLDNVGNETVVSTVEGQVDLTPPEVLQVTPQTAWDSEKSAVVATVTDNGALASVVITGGKADVPMLKTETGMYTADLTENGTYTLVATDEAGNESRVAFEVSNIDTEAPEAPTLTKTPATDWANQDVTITASSVDSQSGVASYWYTTEDKPFDSTWQKMEGSTLTLASEQDSTYYVAAMDGVGRVSPVSSIHVALDKTAPQNLVLKYEKGAGSGFYKDLLGWLLYKDSMTFSVTAEDSASGVARYAYQLVMDGEDLKEDGWAFVDGDEKGFTKTLTNKDMTGSLYVRAYDLAGNGTEITTELDGSGKATVVILENTEAEKGPAPVITATTPAGAYTGAWTNQDVTLTASGAAAVSGIDHYEYRVDNENPDLTDTDWTKFPESGEITVAEDTNATYYIRAVTNAGNDSPVSSQVVRVQKTVPNPATLSWEAPDGQNGWYRSCLPAYQVNIPAQATYAAPVSYTLATANMDGTTEETVTDTTEIQLPCDGIWTITLTTRDEAGNTAEISSNTFYVDTTAPTGAEVLLDGSGFMASGEINYYTYRNTTVHFDASAEDSCSGIEGLYYQKVTSGKAQDSAWERFPVSGLDFGPEARFYLAFMVVDYAGNATYFDSQGVTLDGTAPVGDHNGPALDIVPGSANLSPYGYYNGDVTVSVALHDPEMGEQKVATGISSVFYKIITDGVVTQEGTLKAGSDIPAPLSWNGTFTVPAEANNSDNVVLEVSASDCAGNWRTSSVNIKIDVDAPVVTVSYAENKPSNMKGGTAYFTGKRTLTVNVEERNFNPATSIISVLDKDTGNTVAYTWSDVAAQEKRAVLTVDKDGDYAVTAKITDLAGNVTDAISFDAGTVAGTAFVLDNTQPQITVSYDNNRANNGRYFNAARTATVTVIERNFDPALIREAITTPDGRTPSFSPWQSNGSTHTATLTFAADGDYGFAVGCEDLAGNRSAADYQGTAPTSFVIDTTPSKISMDGVVNGKSYAGKFTPAISIADVNAGEVTVKLLRTRLNEIDKDVTEDYFGDLDSLMETVDGGKALNLDVFQDSDMMDGLYTLTVSTTDMAGNAVTEEVQFTLNRHGSVYVYDEALRGVMDTYTQAITADLVITEYNPSRLVAGSARVTITKDGEPLQTVILDVNPVASGTEAPGNSGWFEYVYTINRENFTEDGVYEVTLSTQDEAGNYPETSEEKITFAVDTTAPELNSLLGLEKKIVNAKTLNISLSATDNVALAEIVAYCGGKEIAKFEDLDGYRYDGSFTLGEGMNQHIRLVLTDKAGNILDTDSEGFAPGYAFQDVTVSSNFFLRWYANKPLFIGSIIGIVALILLCFVLLAGRKNRKAQERRKAEKAKAKAAAPSTDETPKD